MHAVFHALAQFQARDYGVEYIDLLEGDRVVAVEPSIEPEGWAYGRNLRTDMLGWFPQSALDPRKL